MYRILSCLKISLLMLVLGSSATFAQTCSPLLDHTLKRLGETQTEHLCEMYQGKVVLVVNTASKCAFTRQYEGLEALYAKYKQRGLVVLGFPSNDFAGQEPGTEKEISDFCRLTYSVQFPMFEKVHARRGQAHPFYQSLAKAAGEYPRWNFHKYLISPQGQLIGSYQSRVAPNSAELVNAIEDHLPHE